MALLNLGQSMLRLSHIKKIGILIGIITIGGIMVLSLGSKYYEVLTTRLYAPNGNYSIDKSKILFKIKPDKKETLQFTITNDTDDVKTYDLRIKSPEKLTDGYSMEYAKCYTILLDTNSLTIEPKGSAVFNVSIRRSKEKEIYNYEAWLEVSERTSSNLWYSISARLLLNNGDKQ